MTGLVATIVEEKTRRREQMQDHLETVTRHYDQPVNKHETQEEALMRYNRQQRPGRQNSSKEAKRHRVEEPSRAVRRSLQPQRMRKVVAGYSMATMMAATMLLVVLHRFSASAQPSVDSKARAET